MGPPSIQTKFAPRSIALQVKRQCQEQLYSTPACILHAPGRDKATFKDMFDTLANTRKDTRPWVELY